MFFGKSLFSRFQIRNQAGKEDSSQRTLLRQNSAGEPLEERRLLAVSGNSLLSRWFGRSAGGATKRGSVRPRSLWQEMFASSGSGARRRHSFAACGGFAVEMLEDRRLLFNPVGTDWGVGATVSFGYMADGVMDSGNLDGGWTNTALTTMVTAGTMPATFDVEIERALLTWSRLANINFNEVADGGEDFGDPGPADIRIGAHFIDGNMGANTGAHAFFPPPNTDARAGDLHFDTANTFQVAGGSFNLFNFAMHEFGHSIGLGHSMTGVGEGPLMNPSVPQGDNSPFIFGAHLDDLQGAQLIYGPRALTSVTVSAADDPAPFAQEDDGTPDEFRLVRRTETLVDPNGNYANRNVDVIDVLINGNYAYSLDYATLTTITINGSSDDDTLIVDYSGGDPVPSGGIVFAGGDGTDELQTINYVGIDVLTVNHNTAPQGGPFSGTVQVGSTAPLITYSGLEPLVNMGDAADIVYNLPDTADEAILEDDGDLNNDITRLRSINGTFETTTFTNPTNSLTINLGDGGDILSIVRLDSGWDGSGTTINLNGGDAPDEIRIAYTPTGVVTNVDLDAGVPDDRVVIGSFVGSNGNTAISFAQFNTGVSTLDFINGEVNVDDSGGVGELYVDDSGDTDADTVTFTNASIMGAAPAQIDYVSANIGIVQLALGSNNDQVTVQSTGTNNFGSGTVIFGNAGNDVFTIAGNALSSFNDFQGGLGDDEFVLNIPAGTSIGSNAIAFIQSLTIQGGDNTLPNRDRLTINDQSGIARNLNYAYDAATPGGVNIAPGVPGAGLFGAVNHTLAIRTMETVVFNDGGDNNDIVGVTGTAQSDLMTVGLLNNNTSAMFFLGGTPYVDPTDPGTGATVQGTLPGVAGGGTGPDLRINGMVPGSGLTLDGGTNDPGQADRAVVYAASEDDLVDPTAQAATVDIFGFGDGVLIPGFGAGNAFDDITVNPDGGGPDVVVTNTAVGPLTPVFLDDADFQQVGPPATQPAGLTVNGGDESGVRGIGPLANVADDFNVTVSTQFGIQINGNLPPLTLSPAGEPQGDQLNATILGSINVFSDAGAPPTVTITGTQSGDFGISFSSIERAIFTPTNGRVNIIGDNNDPTVTQNDYFQVTGRDVGGDPDGANEFQLKIGGNWDPATGAVDLSAPIYFQGVSRINAGGGHATGFDVDGNAIFAETDTGVDALDMTPYANNTPLGWGIETYWNEGDPVIDGGTPSLVDLLIYNAVPGVSDAIVVQPSGSEAGQVFAINAATGTPIAVINYTLNADIIVNANDGTLGDTDTLTLRGTDPANPGTSGLEDFTINLTAAGTPADPLVIVDDTFGGLLYRIQDFTNINTLNVETLAGSDFISIIGADDGSVTINVDGGLPSGAGGSFDVDTIELIGTTGSDTFLVVPGATNDSGRLEVRRSGATAPTIVNFTAVERVTLDGRSGADADTVTVQGTGGNDTFTLNGVVGTSNGTVRVNDGPQINFNSLGAGSDVFLNGLGGDDNFFIAHPADWGIMSVNIDGGPPIGSDSVQIVSSGVDETFTFTPLDADSALLVIASGTATDYNLNGVEHLLLDAAGAANDQLFITATNSTITPGQVPGSAIVEPADANGNPQLGISYRNVEVVEVTGTAAVIRGTHGDDTISLDVNGIVTVTNALGFTNSIDVSNVLGLVFDLLGGNDTISIAVSALFPNGIRVRGGEPGSGSDVLDFIGAGGAIAVDLGNNRISEGAFFVDYSDVEQVNIISANLTSSLTVIGTGGDDTINFTPTGGGVGSFTASTTGSVLTTHPIFTYLVAAANPITVNGIGGSDVLGLIANIGNNRIDLAQTAANAVSYTQDTFTQLFAPINIDRINLNSLAGNDIIRITQSDALVATPADSIPIDVDAGPPNASDRLAVVDDGLGDLVLHRLGEDGSSGRVNVGPLAPISYVGVEHVDVVEINNITGGTGTDGLGRLVVFKHDPLEENDTLPNATFAGVGVTINVDPTIDPAADGPFELPGDEDWYQVEALATGTLDFQVFFEQIGTLDNGRAGLPGNGDIDIQLYDADGTLIVDGTGLFGLNDADDNERIRIPAVQGQVYYLRVFGATEDVVNVYSLAIINEPAPVPYDLELDDVAINPVPNPPGGGPNSDTGRSQFDNVTYDNTPTLFFRLDDAFFLQDLPGNPTPDTPPDEVIVIPFQPGPAPAAAGYAIAIFDEGEGTTGATPPQEPLGFAVEVPGQPGVYTFTTPVLTDGSHFLTARVMMIDPADPQQTGFGPRSLSLEIIVDTVPPNVSFGDPADPDDGLAPDSDTGVSPPNPDTIVDRITSDTTPTFWGRAEANSIIRLFVDHPTLGVPGAFDPADIFIGQDTAIPLDGTNQEPDGYWEVTSIVDFNDPNIFPLDGLRTVFVTAEDLAGNVNPGVGQAVQELDVFIDTQGPQITNVQIADFPDYDLFNPKGPEANAQGPTPLVKQLKITFRDLPNRVAPDFLFRALKDETVIVDHFQIIGDQSGRIAIQDVILVQDPPVNGQPATAMVTLVFFAPLPEDRFTLIITDDIRDLAGNRLDGETNAAEPVEDPDFLPPGSSGDGVPGGDFVARFTVDSRPELGLYAGLRVYVDLNGNFVFDPEGQDNDAVNRDIVFRFGSTSDSLFAGKFRSPGPGIMPVPVVANRFFDQIAAYGNVLGSFRWIFDFDSDGVADLVTTQPAGFQINGTPVAGNFDGNFANGDEIGLFDGVRWWFDTNHDFIIDGNDAPPVTSAISGFPQVGDVDGDTLEDLITYQNDTFFIDFGFDGYGNLNATVPLTLEGGGLGFPGVSERPTVADMNQDGVDDLGVWVPGNLGQAPGETSEWFFLVSEVPNGLNATHVPGTPVVGSVPGTLWAFPSHTGIDNVPHFQPVPFGTSLFAIFGDEPAFPLVGNFDPPVIGGPTGPDIGGNGTLRGDDFLVVAPGPGAEPRVLVYDRITGEIVMDVLAYHPNFRGGVQVATGDVNGDGTLDIITAPGPGGGPHVRVFSGATGNVLQDFMAYHPNFNGGVFLAVGDFNGDGRDDIVTAPGAGGGPHVRIFSGTGGVLGEYMAYHPNFTGGVHPAVGDVNGDGTPDIITAPGAGGGPHVRIFSGTSSNVLQEYMAYHPNFTGGVWVAAGDVNGDGHADVITGAGPGGGPHVRVLSGADGSQLHSFFAYAPAFNGGVRVATGDFDMDGRADILTGPGTGGGPHVRAFDGDNLSQLASFFAFDSGFTGGVFVAAPAAAGGSPLRAASVGSGAEAISQAELDVIVSAAISQWNAGSKLRNVRVQVADLPGSYLGLAYNDLVLIDSDAAGHGWFVDSTPETSDDLDSARIDLLSAVVHELGHVLGLDDAADADDVMGEVLEAGVRRTSGIDAVDSVFAEIG